MGTQASILITAKLPQHHSVEYHGIPIVIEWPKGCVREGKDKNGKGWRREMKADYGYIDDTSAAGDTEALDIYIGSDRKEGKVFVIEQLDEDGEFDEYKLVTGVPDLESAQQLYLAHYPKEWGEDRLGDCYETDLDHLRVAVEKHQDEAPQDKQAGERHGGPTPTKGEAEHIRQFLQERVGPSTQVLVVGSVGEGTQGPGSDIDILMMPPEGVDVNEWIIDNPENINKALAELGFKYRTSPMSAAVQCDIYEHETTGAELDLFYGEPEPWASHGKQATTKRGVMNKTAGDEKMLQLWNSVRGTEDDQAGTMLTGFYGDGPATCMDCIHRTPHSKTAEGEEVDSCNHKLVKLDPELTDRRLPDGTIKVDADDWCRFAQKPVKEEGEAPGKPASRQIVKDSGAKSNIGAIYLRTLASMN
jgi:hypothetical protein